MCSTCEDKKNTCSKNNLCWVNARLMLSLNARLLGEEKDKQTMDY